MTCPKIQKDTVIACKIETIKGIIKELNDDYFSLLVDESFDVSRKEQMTVVLPYVDRRVFVMERLLDIVHVKNTSALSLKEANVNLLSQHSLGLSYVRGQCYDGASNMQGDINGFKMLIKKESRSAYYIHCFVHQLQLTFVGVSKRCLQVGELIQSNMIYRIAQTYEVAFILHLMKEVLGITNDLSTCLQKKEQYIANAMLLVKVAKRRLQELRENERWDLFVIEVSTFCIKYNIVIPNFDESYVNSGRSRRKPADYTIFHHYRIEKIMRMVELYPDDFDELSMCALDNQLANYIIDVHDIDKRFSDLHGLFTTASVKKAFSTMKFKNELQSQMNDEFLSCCMIPFMEKDVFNDISTDDIILSFQAMKPCRIVL
ncbi:hypothetical protein H5410_044894 [Solanum commersonii]|uniref:DUF4371 domain-containing protein n=1 Tax=Solanum commersonii TaxID=4109 RepID=A0A9J5XB80_SOLCO|nr:hypothetical protein H5410_044894 [Solanum commersonii]